MFLFCFYYNCGWNNVKTWLESKHFSLLNPLQILTYNFVWHLVGVIFLKRNNNVTQLAQCVKTHSEPLTWLRIKWCVKTSSAVISLLHLLGCDSRHVQHLSLWSYSQHSANTVITGSCDLSEISNMLIKIMWWMWAICCQSAIIHFELKAPSWDNTVKVCKQTNLQCALIGLNHAGPSLPVILIPHRGSSVMRLNNC